MKCSIGQLQALDFLQKRLTSYRGNALFKKDLKLVIKYENTLWYGDFLVFKGSYPSVHRLKQNYIEQKTFSDADTPIISKTLAALEIKGKELEHRYHGEQISKINHLPIFFDLITQIINGAEITKNDSPFESRLFNAVTLDGSCKLPFIDLDEDCEIELISIIEVSTT